MGRKLNEELKSIGKETVLADFKIPEHIPRGTDEYNKNLSF
jgi:hypothetical protein